MSANLFPATRTVYWPGEFDDVVRQLKGQDADGRVANSHVYRFNTGIMVLAAVLGLREARTRDVGSSRQEISTDTFRAHGLDRYLLLIPLLGRQSVECLRPDQEGELLREFERYAAGGFEVLRGLLSNSSDPSGQAPLQQALLKALEHTPVDDSGMPDILAD